MSEDLGNDWQAENQGDPFANQTQSAGLGGPGGTKNEPEIEDVITNAQTLGKRALGPLLVAWGGAAGIDLLFVIVFIALTLAVGAGSLIVMPVAILAGILVTAFRVGLYRPMRLVMTQGPGAVPDIGSVLSQVTPRIGPIILTNLMVGAIVMIGTVLCVLPGLAAAFLLCMAPYYTATGSSPVDALKESFETTKEQWLLIVVAAVTFLVIGGTIQLGVSIAGGILAGILGEYTIIATQLSGWILQTILGAAIWIVFGSVFITIDLAESGETISY